MKERLMVFAKAPVPGQVKTRLRLPDEEAACWHEAFVLDVVERHQKKGRHVSVWRAGDPQHSFWSQIQAVLEIQVGPHLGARMVAAFESELKHTQPVVIIGTDSPSLPPHLVDEAFECLRSKDVVVGPACDGGYYLLGMNVLHRSLFPDDMPWGTHQVLPRTLANINAAGLSVGLLPFWYDVDRPEDLRLLKTHLPLLAEHGVPVPPRTYARLFGGAESES